MEIFNCGENEDSFHGYIIYMKNEKDEIIPFLSREKLDFGEVFKVNEVIEYNLTNDNYLEKKLIPKDYRVLGYELIFYNRKELRNKIYDDYILYLHKFTQSSISNRWCKLYEHFPFKCVPIFEARKLIDLYYYLFNRKDNKLEKVANINTIKDYIEKIYLTKEIDDNEIYTDRFGNNIIRNDVFCYYEKTETIDDIIKKGMEDFKKANKSENSEKRFFLGEVSDIYDKGYNKGFYSFEDVILRIKSFNSKGDIDNFSVDKIDVSINPDTNDMTLYNPNYNLFKYISWHSISFYFKGKDFKDYEMTIFNLNINKNLLAFNGCICETHYDEYQINLKNVETPILDTIKAVYDAKIEKELLEGNELKPLNLKEDCIQGHKMTNEESAKMQWQEEARAAQQVKECEEALLKQVDEYLGINHNKMPTITSIQAINIKNINGTVSAIDFIPDSFSIDSSTEQTDYTSNNPCVLPEGAEKAFVISNSDKTFSFKTHTVFGIPNNWVETQVLCSADNGKDYWITFSVEDYNTKLERKSLTNSFEITGHWYSMEIKETKKKKMEKMHYPRKIEDIHGGILYSSNHTTYMKDITSLIIDEGNNIFRINLNGQHEYISPYDYNYDIKLSAFNKIRGNYTIQIILDRDCDDIKFEITPEGSRIIGHFKEIKIDDKLSISQEEAEKHTIKGDKINTFSEAVKLDNSMIENLLNMDDVIKPFVRESIEKEFKIEEGYILKKDSPCAETIKAEILGITRAETIENEYGKELRIYYKGCKGYFIKDWEEIRLFGINQQDKSLYELIFTNTTCSIYSCYTKTPDESYLIAPYKDLTIKCIGKVSPYQKVVKCKADIGSVDWDKIAPPPSPSESQFTPVAKDKNGNNLFQLSGCKITFENGKTMNVENTKLYIKEEKSMNNMFGKMFADLKFGTITPAAIKYSIKGIAFESEEGKYFVYKDNEAIDVTNMVFDMPMVQMPIATNKIQTGDIILHQSKYVIVKELTDDGIKIIYPLTNEIKTIIPQKNLFGFDFITKIINPFENFAESANEDNPFGNMLPFMLMDGNKDMKDIMIMSMMCGGKVDFSNPMMMYMMMKDGDVDPMMFLLMGNNNPFRND